MNKIKLLKSRFLMSISVYFLPFFVFAAAGSGENACPPGQICNPLKYNDIYELMSAILTQVAYIGGIVVVFFMIYSGFLFVTSRGNEEKLKKAKWAFFGACVGAVLVLGAVAITGIIETTIKEVTTPTP